MQLPDFRQIVGWIRHDILARSMDDRLARLESDVALLAERVTDLELRLRGLQAGSDAAVERRASAVPASEGLDEAPVQRWLALGGRTLVVLGGAYLLRALTEAHVFSTQTGVAFGLMYGAPWLILAARAGARGVPLDALFHGLATALIGYPLVWEATVRFGVLEPAQSAALLGVLTTAALVLSALARLHGLAWTITLGALGSAVSLAIATRDWNSYTLLSLVLGLETLWVAHIRNWRGLCWVAAGVGNLMLVVASGRAAVSGSLNGALLLQFLLFAGYIGTLAVRSVAANRRLTVLDVAQGTAATVIALGGSILLLRGKEAALVPGLAALAVGTSAYAVAFGFVRVRRDCSAFFLWAAFALLLTTVGAEVCLGASTASVVFAAAAIALAVTARRGGSLTLNLHAIVYALAAVGASGLGGMTAIALLQPSPAEWGSPDMAALVTFVALSAVAFTPVPPGATSLTVTRRLPRLVLMCMLVWTSMGLAVWLAVSVISAPGHVDVSTLAAIRTAVLVAATLIVARVARYESGREAGALTYPLLVITGLKLLLVDLLLGRPETLFPALALYGTALIAAPRLSRRLSGPRIRTATVAPQEEEKIVPLEVSNKAGHV